jgi:hypothetical protein
MRNRFEAIKAQLDSASEMMDEDVKTLRSAIALLLKGYQEIVDLPGSEADLGLRLAKKIAEEYVQFDVDEYRL